MKNQHDSDKPTTSSLKPEANFEKQIKRKIYGKPQSILVTFPAGLASIAGDEVEFILNNLWFQNKFATTMTVLKNALHIEDIHMFAVLELLMRGQCFSDIRLIINEGNVNNMPAFAKRCHDIDWDFYVTPDMSLKLKVDAGASPALHEGAMKDILLQELDGKIGSVVSGEDAHETTALYVDVYKYELVMSISLAGEPLYKRGFRTVLSNSAPLREDIAACCTLNALQFATKNDDTFVNDSLLVPFSGTGTFLFEFWMAYYQLPPALFPRKYAIEVMPLFRADHFNYLQKKAREHCLMASMNPQNFYCIDNSAAANAALLNNIENFKQAVESNQLVWTGSAKDQWVTEADFFAMNVEEVLADLPGNIFLPINPPYGIRLGNSNETVQQYKQIAKQINAIAKITNARNNQVIGYILCPSEDSWSWFCKTLTGATIDTYHITQGGLDIRVAQFHIGSLTKQSSKE